MNLSISPYLSLIKELIWHQSAFFVIPNDNMAQWLLEDGSLTQLLKSHCEHFEVTLLSNGLVGHESLTLHEQQLLPQESFYIQRQVILSGDHQPWVLGRTIMPMSTIDALTMELAELGTIPLGEIIFTADHIERDNLMFATLRTNGQSCHYARSSRLWINEKPIVVTELFLPDAPMYREGKPV
jgi:chorismate--pyruvate lyase